ncbi:MAG: CoB--CoM heterodisulfide reductase iron-sulfur subunit A family protein [Chloroflexota bacterium]|nr:MAG: CoB--CoM heterodisulfide reductase iron-sulfur subunit A family protein [Chloroflexota bacterium]
MARIGVFVCHCGTNIAGVVDVKAVRDAASKIPGVVFVADNKYTCSDTGQGAVVEAIKTHKLDRVVIAACSPRMHEKTFRKAADRAGMNPYMVEMANIREHCSWVHGSEKEAATDKALDIVKMMVAKTTRDEPLFPKQVGLVKRALVIGGGIAGIQAALDIAESGYEVVLVEREPTIGGRMAQLDKTFPTLDCSSCILTPKMVDVGQHPNIRLMTYSEVKSVKGFVGNFEVEILKKARLVNEKTCTGCGVCWSKCPEYVDSEFDVGMGKRKAIYTPFAQAVPNIPVIDQPHCRYIKYLEAQKNPLEEGQKLPPQCRICEKLCQSHSITWDQQDELLKEQFGVIVVATGYKPFDYGLYGEYGGGKIPDVISILELERLLSASGPTGGEVKRPSDGKHPKEVVFISCVGSRDDRIGKQYCSKVCCMVMCKQSILLKEHDPDVQSYVFYIDMRTPGKGYDEFYRRSQEEYGTMFLRGRVSKLIRQGDKVIVKGEDSLMGRPVEIAADMVVLAVGMEPNEGAVELAQTLNCSYDQNQFLSEAHPKLRPLETQTDGILLAGTVSGPRDVPESVAQGSGAAAKALGILTKMSLVSDPLTSIVDPMKCVGCFGCMNVCPFNAVEQETLRDGRVVSKINENVCKGCGLCVSTCRGAAITLRGFSDAQLLAEVTSLCR